MTLKKKIASILLLIMVISTIVYFGVFKLVIYKSFVEAENSDAVHDMHQCISVLNLEIKHLNRFVNDWSSWDDAYKFATNKHQEFIKENLEFTEYRSQGLNLIHFYGRDGRLIWGKTYDLKTEKEIPLNLARDLNSSFFLKLVTQQNPDRFTSGIIQTSSGPMLISARPILTSDNKGPSHGALIMGRLFTRESLTALSEQVGVELMAWSVKDEHMPKAIRELVPLLSDDDSVRLIYASSDILHAYSIVKDISNKPVIIMEASFPRNITHKGTRAYVVGMIFILGVGLLVFISISGVLGTYILKPIAKLTENALAIGVSTTSLKGFETNRGDEIGVLSREFAAMLARLSKSEERYRILAENARDVIWVFDLNLGYTYVSPSVMQLRGYSVEEALKQSLDQILTPESYQNAKVMLDREFALEFSGQRHGPEWSFTTELEMVRKDGSTVWTEVILNILYDENDKPKGFMGISRDITERNRMYKELQQSQQIMRLVLDTIPVGVFWKDKDSKYLGCNRQFAIYAGIGSGEEIIGKDDHDMPWVEHSELYIKNDRKVLESGMPIYNFEHLERKSDGNTAFLSTSKVPLYDADGKINGLLGTYDNITVRKQAEEAIRKSEERYRTIFESTATANIIIAEDSTILLANSDFADLAGYSKQELEGKFSWTGFVEKDDLEKMKSYHMMRRLDPGSAPSSYEFRFINRKGEVRNLFMSVALIPETKESVASMIDITDWKRSEQARSESEERFKELAELLPETVYEADRNGVFTFVNKTGFEKFGYAQEDVSKKMSVFDMIIPQDHPRMIATYEKLVKGERVGLGEYTTRKKDGSTFPALVHATAIYHDGKPVGHRGFLIDLSEKKTLENQLTRAQKMEAIGTLAGGIAHDFNNLLMGILGNISLILLTFDQTHPIYDRLKSMEGYVQRGSDLTKQLLGFARGGKYEVKPTDLGEFIRESSELFGRTKKEIRIHNKAQECLWTVEVDRGQMEQVLLNLYVNAWHAMPSGGDLFLSAENVELSNIDVSPYDINPGKFVKVTVTDTGIGMDEVTKTKIFEPFFTTKERGRGTGLGLASAYGIIKNHGGFIDVESEKDIGTSFMIYLPVSDKDVDYDKIPEEDLLKGRETVLLIDDEEMILDVSAKMLEELGYKVITATGGREGLLAYEQNKDRIDLVILDMIMPEFGGREVFDTMIRINPSVRVLLSSGYSLDSQAKEIMQRGCKGFIQKPFTMTALSKKIREILDKQ